MNFVDGEIVGGTGRPQLRAGALKAELPSDLDASLPGRKAVLGDPRRTCARDDPEYSGRDAWYGEPDRAPGRRDAGLFSTMAARQGWSPRSIPTFH
jgi:hypothetical protein